jgi:hypothetical protein
MDQMLDFRRDAVMAIMVGTIKATPVLSGRLRGDWRPGLGSESTADLPPRSEAAAIADATATTKGWRDDGRLFFTNRLPYAARVEYDGWAHAKAPAGMLRITIAAVLANVRKHVKGMRLFARGGL